MLTITKKQTLYQILTESDDHNSINEDVNRTKLTQTEKINMNTSIKLPKKNKNLVHHITDGAKLL